MPSFAADLERTEVLIPWPIGGIRLRLPPLLQAIEVFRRDLALAQPFKQVVANRDRQPGPLNFRHLFAERHPGQVFLETLLFLRITRARQAVSEIEEELLFLLPSFEAGLDQLDDHAVRAAAAIPGQGLNAACDTGRKADALTHEFLGD